MTVAALFRSEYDVGLAVATTYTLAMHWMLVRVAAVEAIAAVVVEANVQGWIEHRPLTRDHETVKRVSYCEPAMSKIMVDDPIRTTRGSVRKGGLLGTETLQQRGGQQQSPENEFVGRWKQG